MSDASPTPVPDLLLRALSWVDLLIFAEVQRVRSRGRALSKDSPWGAHIGEEEVDEVLGELFNIAPPPADSLVAGELRAQLDRRRLCR